VTTRIRKFDPGQLVATPGVRKNIPLMETLAAVWRHAAGDWGIVSKEDWAANDLAIREGTRLLSVYRSTADLKFYVLTEAANGKGVRERTTVLLPSEY
jgi:hypothetical protein